MASRLSNVNEKLERRLQDGQFYEAQQIVKTLCFRYKAQKKWDEAIELLTTAAQKMLQHRQVNEGADLGQMLVDIYTETNVPETQESLGPLVSIFCAFPTDEPNPVKYKFMKAALKWSSQVGSLPLGSPQLHKLTALSYWKDCDYAAAQRHFLRAGQPSLFAEMLTQWAHTGNKDEEDLFIARAVLQLLALKQINDARAVLSKALSNSTAFDSPLIHFCKFLIQVCEERSSELFQILKDKYEPSLNRDPSFAQYLTLIGKEVFGIQSQRGGLSGMLNDLMGMFSQMGQDDS
eukprot:GILK01005912.1.p1 GENE.GILK01005912.1~~GILK01005912.1.p1  ORF type:complete len:291 (+),score=52.19 GILK01005912.1:68-940(+)